MRWRQRTLQPFFQSSGCPAYIKSLPSNYVINMLRGCDTRSGYRWARQPGSVLDHAMERDPLLRGGQRQRERENEEGARGALPHLLAADFRFHLPARISGERCTGSDAGFFCDGA